MSDYTRPTVVRWLWYGFGGRLPGRNHTWVLHDITCRTWVFRHIFRGLFQICIPVVLVTMLLPAPLYLRMLTAIAAGGPCLLGYTIMTGPISEYRLLKAGYRPAIAEQIRSHRAVESQAIANHARRERIAARRATRSSHRGQ